MIQKQNNNRRSGRAHSHQEQKGAASPEFNTEHAHCFFDVNGIVHCEFVPPNTTVNYDFHCYVFETLERKCETKKIVTLTQPQLASSSRQRACQHVPENHSVCD
jgi:hypothetical protein